MKTGNGDWEQKWKPKKCQLLVQYELTKWELMKWEVDQMEIDKVNKPLHVASNVAIQSGSHANVSGHKTSQL